MYGIGIYFALGLLPLFNIAYGAPSQACRHPDKSPIDWRPKANDTRIFQVGRDPENPREIRVSIPPRYNGSEEEAVPLILAFHDREMNTAEFEYTTRLSDREANDASIVVYPQAKNDTWQSDIVVRRWQKTFKNAQENTPNDIAFAKTLLDDLDTVVCFDKNHVYAAGLGTGGGMVHLLACDPEISTRIAAYAVVAGGFGTKAVSPKWAECSPSRLSIPMLEIHGDDDRILPYLLNDWESAKSRQAVPHWLDEWSDRNGCGSPISEPLIGTDGTGTSVTVTRLEGGGWMSEGEAYNGGALRIAKSCPRGKTKSDTKVEDLPKLNTESDDGTEDKEGHHVLETNPEHFTILHYRIRDYGHGWPTVQLKGHKSKSQPRLFDATELVLDWFKVHKLPGSIEETQSKVDDEKEDNKTTNLKAEKKGHSEEDAKAQSQQTLVEEDDKDEL